MQYDIATLRMCWLCPKAIGILMLRSMSPDVIITDEIAGCDVEAINSTSCGVRIIAGARIMSGR